MKSYCHISFNVSINIKVSIEETGNNYIKLCLASMESVLLACDHSHNFRTWLCPRWGALIWDYVPVCFISLYIYTYFFFFIIFSQRPKTVGVDYSCIEYEEYQLSKFLRWSLMIFIIKGFQITIQEYLTLVSGYG